MTSRFCSFVFLLLACSAKEPARSPASTETPGRDAVTVISWNMKHLGRNNQNTEAAAGILKDADLVTLQEVNSSATGEGAILRLATQLRKLNPNDRICIGLSEIPSDGKERYGYLWKDQRIAFVKTNGEVMASCPSSAVTVRVDKKSASKITREPAIGTFRARKVERNFTLASIHLRPSGKKPQAEVPPLFESLRDLPGPVIVAGDYNLDSGHSAFKTARQAQFKAAFLGIKTSLKSKKRELSRPYDNFWFRNVQIHNAAVINLYEALPSLSQEQIYNSVSDHCPILAELTFAPEIRAPSAE